MKKWIIIGAAVTLVLGLLGSGYFLLSSFGGSGADEEEFLGEAAVDVGGAPIEVELGTVSSLLVLDATVRPEPGRALKAPKGGTVTHLWLNNGDAVENGAPIINVKVPAETTAGADEEGEEAAAFTEVSLYAPTAGTIKGMGDVQVGDVLEPGATVATVAPDQFRAVATVPANDLYRLYEDPDDIMLKIDKGPPASECSFISLGSGEGGAPAEQSAQDELGEETEGGGGGAELSCRVPANLQVFDGVQGQMSVSTGEAEDVVVIPVTAVRGTSEEGEVLVVAEDGSEEPREVTLGLSDGQFVEVTGGLEVGDTIMDPVPLDPRFDVPGAESEEDFDEEFHGMGG